MRPEPKTIQIAGAGVMGLTVAYALKRRFPDAKIEIRASKQGPCASLLAGGMLAPYSEIEYLPGPHIKAAWRGVDFWESLPQSETGFSRRGSLVLAHVNDMHMLSRFEKNLAGCGAARRVDINKLKNLEPNLPPAFQEGIFIEGEACVHPAKAMEYLARACSITERAADINSPDYDFTIDCRGYGAIYDDPELRGVKGETVIVRNTDFSLSRPVRLMHPRYPIYIVPRPNHEFMIGATIIESADHAMTVKGTMELLSAAYSLHPSFGEAEIISTRAGTRPAYPDNLPRIKIEGNIIRCNGLFRHGYLLAPVMAECVADIIVDKDNEFMSLFAREHEHHNQRNEKRHNRA